MKEVEMIDHYIASSQDLSATEEGIQFAFSPKLSFIFSKKNILKYTSLVSFDSKNLFVWTPFKLPNALLLKKCNFENYFLYKIPHKITITDDMHKGWQAGIKKEFIGSLAKLQFTPDNWMERPVISGGFLTPFITIHQEIHKNNIEDAYYTRESYLATIIHEFAHVYYHFHRLWWFSDKKENLGYLQYAKSLFSQNAKKEEIKSIKINIPTPQYFTEVFAFCCEYYAASLFWSDHLKNLHIANIARLKRLVTIEKDKNLDKTDSIFSPSTSHDVASILGIILMYQYPSTWPQRLLKKMSL